jgi:hypothetical protein
MNTLKAVGAKIATFGAGVAIKKGLDYGFDYGLYPFALVWFGYFWGGVLMTVGSVVLNLAVIQTYDWSKKDWLFLETLKGLRECSEASDKGRLVTRILRSGDIPAFFLLSWLEDAIVVTLYLRHGANLFNGLSRRDWIIFWASTVVSNLIWILSLASIIEALRWLL